jgi:hypothetical protein
MKRQCALFSLWHYQTLCEGAVRCSGSLPAARTGMVALFAPGCESMPRRFKNGQTRLLPPFAHDERYTHVKIQRAERTLLHANMSAYIESQIGAGGCYESVKLEQQVRRKRTACHYRPCASKTTRVDHLPHACKVFPPSFAFAG